MPQILRCKECGEWYQIIHVVPEVCPHCQNQANWTTEGDEPIRPYTLTANDRKFLHRYRIAPDD